MPRPARTPCGTRKLRPSSVCHLAVVTSTVTHDSSPVFPEGLGAQEASSPRAPGPQAGGEGSLAATHPHALHAEGDENSGLRHEWLSHLSHRPPLLNQHSLAPSVSVSIGVILLPQRWHPTSMSHPAGARCTLLKRKRVELYRELPMLHSSWEFKGSWGFTNFEALAMGESSSEGSFFSELQRRWRTFV